MEGAEAETIVEQEGPEPASWVKPSRISPSCAANPITSSRQSAFPKATRSESSRGFGSRRIIAATGASSTSSAIASRRAVETRAFEPGILR